MGVLILINAAGGTYVRKLVSLTFLSFFLTTASYSQTGIDITLKRGTKGEGLTKAQLQRLLKTYDLSKWIFTRSVIIEEDAIPHSHPVLTLSARHTKDDELLLSSFVHEQVHWFLSQNHDATEQAKKDLRALLPKVPADFPEGASDEESTYLHLIVNYLEYRADRELLGELKGRQVMEFWSNDHYKWIYKTVLERARDIGNIAFKHKLVPPVRG